MISVASEGTFILINGQLTSRAGKTGGAISASSGSLTIDSIEASGFDTGNNGDVVYVNGANSHVLISNSNFHDNSGGGMGDAIATSTTSETASVRLEENEIKANSVIGGSSAYGGGVSLSGVGTYIIVGNEVSDNSASATIPGNGNFYWSHGGGLSIQGNYNSGKKLSVTLEDNIVSSNRTQLFGGGIYFFLNRDFAIRLT